MRLVFAIPTWNRAEKLFSCVTSIAEQKPDAIYISDNASDDHTQEVCKFLTEKYPFITYVRWTDHVFAEENFKRVVSFAEGDYIWTFGDDDILLPGALEFARKLLEHNLDFYHVAEEGRSSTNTARRDTLFNLCSTVGFLEMTGFMTGNIVKGDKLKSAFETKNWEVYTRSAFPHSLALLEVLANSESALIDIPMIRAAIENPDTVERWKIEKTTSRYVYISDGLMLLRDAGIIPEKVPELFFRYLSGALIKRLADDFLARTFNPECPVPDQEWKCFEQIIQLIEEPRGSILMEWFKRVEAACITKLPIILEALHAVMEIKTEANTIQLPQYPHNYLD